MPHKFRPFFNNMGRRGKTKFQSTEPKNWMYSAFNMQSREQYILKIIIQNTKNSFYTKSARRISKHIFFYNTMLIY